MMTDDNDLLMKLMERAEAAHSKADRANTRLDSHESICAERYDGITNMIKGLYGRFWIAASALIVILLGVSGYLIKVLLEINNYFQ